MPVPRVMIYEHQDAGGDEYGFGQFHPWETAQVLEVEDMAANAES